MDASKRHELDELKARFFANISHEFRTPLTLILGQNEQLQQIVGKEELSEKFLTIERNAQRLLDLINQVLDLSKIEAGKVELKHDTLDIIAFLKHIFFSFKPIAEQKRMQLVFNSPVEELVIHADPPKLERVFFNLFSNACKFTEEGGSVTVRVQQTADKVAVSLQDTGIGIRPEKLPYIFDRFYQVKVEGTQTYTGTGIGLALVKELVELHEGTISASSEVGKGTLFTVELPIGTQAVEEEAGDFSFHLQPIAAKPAAPDAAIVEVDMPSFEDSPSVLVIDDNDEIRAYLKEELSRSGYHVLQAENGQKGLEKAQAHLPDLIISDVMMPVMDGYEVAKQVRADERISHIPLILLTAKASEESKIHGLKIGVDDYLFKPFSSSELKVRVANLIMQRKRLRERFKTATIIKPSEVSVVPADQIFLKKVIDFIELQMNNPLFGVEDLGAEVGMSVTHLNRKLNALIDQPAGHLIRSMRMQRAVELLEKGAGNISEVAYEVGYSGPSHFTRSFKKQFGYPPSEYNKRKETVETPS